jgi:diketogulonate reductase-like aldo/keto reductase
MASSLTLQSTLSLKSGTTIPRLGFGVWDSPSHLTTQSCLSALKTGYRHIDTAQVYGNEAEVGKAVRESGLKREEIFVTSKVLTPGDDDEATYQKVLESVKKIDGEDGYLDLMLIHNNSSGPEAVKMMWQAMEKLQSEGRLKAIGVSNFGVGSIDRMKEYAQAWPPAVNQLELHPWLQQREVVSYCQKNGVAIEAYCPLVRNQKAEDPVLSGIASKHGKSTAQVLLRYCLQKDWVPLPKSDNSDRIAQNADVYGFELSQEDMSKLDEQNTEGSGSLVLAVSNE